MKSAEEQALEAILHARQCSRNRDPHAVIAALTSIERNRLLCDLEASILLASTYNLLFMHEQAKALLTEMREFVAATGDASVARRWQNLYANQFLAAGDLIQAEELFRTCLASAERDQHQRLVAYCSGSLGILYGLLGEVDLALANYNRGLAASQQFGSGLEIARTHHNIGVTMREWGRGEQASPHFMHAADFYSQRGVAEERAFTAAERAILVVEFGDPSLAEHLARTAVERCSLFSNPTVEAAANRSLGVVLRETGQKTAARTHLSRAISLAEMTIYKILQADAHEDMAILELLEGNPDGAEFHRQKALEAFTKMGTQKHCERLISRFERVRQACLSSQ